MKKHFKVTYTLLLEAIPNEMYPEYNDGYNTKQVCEYFTVKHEDEILEQFAGAENVQDFSCKELKTGQRVEDREGNQFVITEFTFDRDGHELNGVSLKGQGGEKEISIHDLKFYKEI